MVLKNPCPLRASNLHAEQSKRKQASSCYLFFCRDWVISMPVLFFPRANVLCHQRWLYLVQEKTNKQEHFFPYGIMIKGGKVIFGVTAPSLSQHFVSASNCQSGRNPSKRGSGNYFYTDTQLSPECIADTRVVLCANDVIFNFSWQEKLCNWYRYSCSSLSTHMFNPRCQCNTFLPVLELSKGILGNVLND